MAKFLFIIHENPILEKITLWQIKATNRTLYSYWFAASAERAGLQIKTLQERYRDGIMNKDL
jgi:hypothetical protein